MTPTLIPELERYRDQFQQIKRDARDLVSGLSASQLTWRPAPNRWSIAECLAHLKVTGDVYLPGMESAMEQARAAKLFSNGPFRHGALGNWFIGMLEPPPRFRVKAPARFVNGFSVPPDRAIPEFFALQDTLIERLQQANGLDLTRPRIVSPISRFLKFSLGQCFALLAAHERRHLWQARQVRNTVGFPSH